MRTPSLAILIWMSCIAAASADSLKVRLRITAENVRAREALEQEFRSALGDINDVVVSNQNPVDEYIIINGLVGVNQGLQYSTVVLDMDSFLMAARDSVREIDIDKLKATLKQRQVSGTVAFATVSSCNFSELKESVVAAVRGLNKGPFQELREALEKYGALSTAPKLVEDTKPTFGQ